MKISHLVRGVIAASSACGVILKPLRERAGDDDRGAAGELHHVGIADPVGRGDDDLVAGVDRGEERVEEHLLAAGRDDDLVGGVVEAVLAGELGGDGAAQLGDALGRGVAGLAAVDGGLAGGADVGGRVEVGLAGGETDDVAARRPSARGRGR